MQDVSLRARGRPDAAAGSAPRPTTAPLPWRRRRGAMAVTLVLVLYTALAFAGFWHAWSTDPSQYALSGGGDQAASMWFLTWVPYALLHGHNPLVSHAANVPYGLNLLVNTSTLALGLVAMPVTLLFGAVVSYNLLCTLAFATSAWAAYVLVRRFTAWRPAAFVGGLLYGFSPYMISQGVGHLNLYFVPLPPLILLVLHDILVRRPGRPWRRGAVLGLLVVVQFFISSEILLGTVIMGAAATVLCALSARRRARESFPYVLRALASAGVVAVALLAYPIWFAFAGPDHIVGPIQSAPQVYRADLLGSVLPDNLQRIAPARLAAIANRFAGNSSENGSYLGLPLVILLVAAVVVLWRDLRVRIVGLLGAFALLLSLGSRLEVDNHIIHPLLLPEAAFDKLPFFQNVIPARYSLYVVLSAAVVLGIVLERVRRSRAWPGRAAALAVTAALGAVVLVPLVPVWPYPMEPAGPPPYFTSAAADAIPAGSVALLYPFPDANFANPAVWQAATFLRFRMPGGRFIVPGPRGRFEPSRPSLTDTTLTAVTAGQPPARSPELRSRIVAQLRQWGVRTIVAVPVGADWPQAESYLVWLLGRQPVPDHGVDAWYGW